MVNHCVLLQGNSFSVKPDQMQVGADSPALQYSEVEMKRTGVQAESLFAAEKGTRFERNYESPSQTLMIF